MTWLIVVLCLAVSFTFAGIEAGLLSLNPVRLRYQVKQRNPAAIKLQGMLQTPQRLLFTVLLVTNLMNIVSLILITNWMVALLGAAGYGAAFLIGLPIYSFAVELLPKSLFRRFPYRALAALAKVLHATCVLLSPVIRVASFLGGRLLLNPAAEAENIFVAREEFKHMTAESERHGTLSKVERQMIHGVVDFRAAKARDVMIPMSQVVTARPEMRVSELLELAGKTDIDRVPVVASNGAIVGLVNISDVLLDLKPENTVGAHLRRIVTTEPDEQAYNVIRKLRAARITLGAVVDAKSQPIGIVTTEALMNKLLRAAVA